ncbi:hypothetical protein NA57DRAFT_54707 [Rhizodiscina lignyota]|uniref:GPI-anchored cell wall organization protein Ecm33 n=1 Tax=Rhizodiscina lignyota TaxID=1504668 RepID=A0A9P4MCG4_9PEZI|nr:hypothetical protein NA57DRAFT_54707 [Rhizodiscina lignyota]
MVMLKYVFPALVAVGSVSASCSVSATTTLQNAGDAAALTTCSTFSGSIAIATSTSDNIAINGVEEITGGLDCTGAPNITQIGADSLQKIGDDFTLNNVQTLQTLSFPQLSQVGSIDWQGLPNLATLMMDTEIQDTDSLNIQNTFLSSLQGINLKRCNTFILANNRMLQDVTLQLQNVTGAITFESNGNRLSVDFPNLKSAQNITFRNVPAISIPSLASVNGSLSFIENDGLQNISCPNLTRLDQSLSINTNSALKSFSFPQLQTVKGAVNVENNTALGSISFPKLTTIFGAFDAYGNFSKVSLPAISDVRGAFNIQSSKDISSDCSTFSNEQGPNDVIKGDYQCAGSQTRPGDANTTPSGTSSSGGSSGKTGAAGHIEIPATALTGVLGVLAAMVGML